MIYLHIVCFTLSWFSLKSILARIDYLRFASPSPASAGRPYQLVLTPLWLVFLLLPFLRYLSNTNACHVLPVSANAINVKRFKEEFANHTCDKIIACILRFILIASFPPPSRYSLVYRTSVEGPQWVFRDTGFPLFAARDSRFYSKIMEGFGIESMRGRWGAKITLGSMGLLEILGRDYGIEKLCWGPSLSLKSKQVPFM